MGMSPIIVTLFGGFWLLFGGIAFALSRGVDLAVVGEQAFAVIAAGGLMVGIFVLWSAADLYASGLRTEGVVLENRASRHTAQETVRQPDGRETRREVEQVSFAPVVRFTTREGREIEFHGRGGGDRRELTRVRATSPGLLPPGRPGPRRGRRGRRTGSSRRPTAGTAASATRACRH